jgi:hypothetical protein
LAYGERWGELGGASQTSCLWRACAAARLGTVAPYEKAMRDVELKREQMTDNLRIPEVRAQAAAVVNLPHVFNQMEEMRRVWKGSVDRHDEPPR